MPLMACPKCGQNVSSLASVCPNCSYSLREQRLKEGQLGPQITCRKCGQKISAMAEICPHCGVDFPKRTFNLILAALPVGALIIVYVVVRLVSSGAGTTGEAPAPLTEEPPDISPAATETMSGDSADISTLDTLPGARAIMVDTPPAVSEPEDTTVRSTTRWTSTWVNVRRDPNPEAPVEQQLDPGVRVEVGRFVAGFWEVLLDGQRLGFVANSLLLREPPER